MNENNYPTPPKANHQFPHAPKATIAKPPLGGDATSAEIPVQFTHLREEIAEAEVSLAKFIDRLQPLQLNGAPAEGRPISLIPEAGSEIGNTIRQLTLRVQQMKHDIQLFSASLAI